MSVIEQLQNVQKEWAMPMIPADIPHGDMPGDKVSINATHIMKAKALFPKLCQLLVPVILANPNRRAVVTVCGGSGVGKSEIASLLSYCFSQIGVGSYTLSGDNYPHRIPMYNDAERVRVFRHGGIRGMITAGLYTPDRFKLLQNMMKAETDADPAQGARYPWLAAYQKEGRAALKGYLGTEKEQDFGELTEIVSRFKNGENTIYLKRMGREDTELWYDPVKFDDVNVLIIEWTHGNSDGYQGVDIPILLNSTPAETLAHRRSRNRDGKTDSAFTTMVLEIEQGLLDQQAKKAKLILSKAGEILSYQDYKTLMAAEE